MMIWTISGPAAQGMMTRRVSETEQGELQGAISSLRSLAVIVGPGLFTFTFAYFINREHGWNIPGAPWYLGAGLLFLAMLMSTRIPKISGGGGTEPSDGLPPDVIPLSASPVPES
jgi:DHA1 family tetracycline resistance protein-like MFS transporter